MNGNKGVIIFGASGLIGRYILKEFKNNGWKTIGTYNHNMVEGMIHFDLKETKLDKINLEGVRYGIISSAMTKLEECRKNPIESNLINVLGVKRIIKELTLRGIVPVFISSAAVFDGENGGYTEEDLKNPISIYGKQKAEVEDYIIKNYKDYLIIRPGKVFGIKKGEGVLFSEWMDKYNKGEEIKCADDEMLSPTYVGDVARGMRALLDKDSRGIYNINFYKFFSRYQMAIEFFNYLGIKDMKIKRCSINDFNFSEKRMMNSYMNSSKFIKETGFKFTPLEECYKLIN